MVEKKTEMLNVVGQSGGDRAVKGVVLWESDIFHDKTLCWCWASVKTCPSIGVRKVAFFLIFNIVLFVQTRKL